jgi:HlyD family secretion protein
MTTATVLTPQHRPGTGQPRDSTPNLAIWVSAAMVACLLAVAALVPFDKIVSNAPGTIRPLDQITVLQALDPSIIKTLDVKEGDTVAKGQLLATLDEALTFADVQQARAQVAALAAQVARCEAELQKKPFDPAIDPNDPASSYLQLQKALFDKRAAEYAASVLSYEEKIGLQQVTILKLQTDVARYNEREKISKQIQDMRATLYKSGVSSLLNLWLATDKQVEMQRTLDKDRAALTEARHQIDSAKSDRDAYIQKWFSDTNQELVTARNKLDQAEGDLERAAKHQDIVRLFAAEPSFVLHMERLSVGSVVNPGGTIMKLMPLGARIEAEIQVSPSDIGDVHPGQYVRLALSAFQQDEHGYVEGKVTWVGADALTLDQNNKPTSPYYKVGASVDSYHLVGVPQPVHLVPGMVLLANINVGSRILGRYLLGATRQGIRNALREP